jgi:hypothetical protein
MLFQQKALIVNRKHPDAKFRVIKYDGVTLVADAVRIPLGEFKD